MAVPTAMIVLMVFVGTAGIAGISRIAWIGASTGRFAFERRRGRNSVRLAVWTMAIGDWVFMATAIAMVLVLVL